MCQAMSNKNINDIAKDLGRDLVSHVSCYNNEKLLKDFFLKQ